MNRYILIESRDPFESGDVPGIYRLAAGLRGRGDRVTLFLIQNGVLAARTGAAAVSDALRGLAAAGVEIRADAFSLRERGVEASERLSDVAPAEMSELVALMMGDDPTKVLWH